jgi:hypothetical protein
MTDSTNDVFTLDHFRRALGDVSDLHYDDLQEIPYMDVATRLYLTAGIAVRFASKRSRCPWRAWHLDSFVADGVNQHQLGLEFFVGELRFSSDGNGTIRVKYTDNASNGDAYFDREHLFGWSA